MKAFLLVNDLFDLFFPRLCPGCDLPLQHSEKYFCIYCELQLPHTHFNSYTDNSVYKLFAGRLHLEQADAFLYFVKKGVVQKMMYSLKYKGNEALGEHLGYLYGLALKEKGICVWPDSWVAVPLHADKLKVRGFNQAAAIARGLSKATGIPFVENLILRQVNNGSQTRKKRFERWSSSIDSFVLNPKMPCSMSRIGLVDDVVTTGSTIEICANLLKDSGIAQIQVYALCQAIN